jgi:Ca2+-binding RTX toxin-like protein
VDGGAGADSIDGLKGRDWLRAQAGDDTVDGGDGRDILEGNAGTDTCLNGETHRSCEVTGP